MENQIKLLNSKVSFLWMLTIIFIMILGIILCNKIDNLEKQLLKQQDTTQLCYNLPKNFNYAYKILKDYNKNIDTNTVIRITATANEFNLTNNKQTFKLALGQLLAESGASHFNKEDHILTSNQGALGIGQILPNSAYGYLIKYIKEKDKLIFKQLGCSDFSFVFNNDLKKSEKVNQITGWLNNKTNNIALWGFIMRKNMDLTHNINDALVAYQMGTGGYKSFIDSGGNVKDHEYVVSINNKLNKE